MSTPPEFLALREQEGLNHWTSESASEQFGPGVASAASTEGLHALRAAYPETWHRLVYTWTPELRFDRRVKLSELLASRFCARAMPRHAGDYERVCRYRRAARRLVERFGNHGLAWFTDERLEAYRAELVTGGGAASTASRTVSYLRVVLREWCRWQRARPKVAAKPAGPRRRAGGRAVRRYAAPLTIARLLPALSVEQRAMVALAAGGLLQSEFLALRVEDIWREHGALHVRAGGIRGRPGVACDRVEYLPGWAWDLLTASFDAVGPRRGLLFPPRGGGDVPRASAARGLRRMCDRTLGEGNGVTFAQIRDLAREVLRRAGAPRAAVRQTWTRSDFGRRGPPWMSGVKGLMQSWTELCAPPVALASTGRVPRRAPAGCGVLEAEVSPGGGQFVRVPLPESCRTMSPAEVEAPTGAPLASLRSPRRPPPRAAVAGPAQRVSGAQVGGRPADRRKVTAGASASKADSRNARWHRVAGEPAPTLSQHPLLATADLDRIADRVAKVLRRSDGTANSSPPAGVLTVARLRQELAVAMRRRADERAEDLIAGALAGAGGTWAASNPEKVGEVLQQLGLGVETEQQPGADDTQARSGLLRHDLALGYYQPAGPSSG